MGKKKPAKPQDLVPRKDQGPMLREGELRYDLALQAAQIGTWEWDLQSGQHVWSPTQEALWGYAPGTFPGTTEAFLSRVHPADVANFAQVGERAKETGGSFQAEFRVILPDGSVRWLASTGRYLYDAQGQPTRGLGVVVDITDRKRAQAMLLESESRFRALFDYCPDGVLVVDVASRRILFGNGAMCRMLGCAAEELAETELAAIHPAAAVPRVMAEFGRLMHGMDHFAGGIPVVRRDGRVFLADINASRIEMDGRECAVGIFRDTTERTSAQEALRASGERLHMALDAANMGTWEWDLLSGRLVRSELQEALLGYAPGTFPGTAEGFAARVHPEDLPGVWKAGEQAQQTRQPFQHEFRVKWPDGTVRWTASHGQYVFDAQGQPVRLMGLAFDITERKRAEQERLENAARLETLFEHSPVAIWEEDFSQVKRRVDRLKAAGIEDVAGYLREHRAELAECAAAVKVLRVNQTSATLLGMGKEDLPLHLPSYFTPASLDVFADELAAMAAGAYPWRAEIPLRLPTGDQRTFAVSLSVFPHHEETWSRVLFSFADVTDRKLAEDLNRVQHHLAVALAACDDLNDGLQLCLDAALKIPHLECGGFYLVDERTAGMDLRSHRGLSADFLRCVEHWDAQSPPARLALSGQTFFGRPVDVGTPVTAAREDWLRFLAAIPLCDEGRVIGCLVVASYSVDDLAPLLRDGLQAIAAEAAHAIVRLQAETALKESLLFRREAEKIGRIGAWMVNPATDYLYWTEGVYEIVEAPLDYKPGLEEGLQFYDAESLPALRQAVWQALQDGTPFVCELGLTTTSGKHLWTEVRGLRRVEKGGTAYVIGTFQDITDRKRVEQSLKEREELFSTIVEQAVDSIALIDCQTTQFVEFNTAAHESLGYTREEFAALTIADIQAEHSPELIRRNIEGSGEKGGVTFQTRHRHRQGELRDVRVSLKSLRIKDRHYVAAVWTDITELKRAEEEKLQMERRLFHAQKLESLGVLAGGIAHDFNNILAGIMGFADLARLRLPPSSPALGDIEVIKQSSQRAADLTRQMLAYSGKGRFVIEAVDVSRVVEDTRKMLQMSVSKKAILKYDLTREIPVIQGDASQIQQIVLNLVLNASDALGERNGVVAVCTDATWLSEADCQAFRGGWEVQPGLHVRLTVQDTGCGMDEETLERIFDPFFTTKFTGRGLGLAAVYGIVRGHKGAVQVASTPGKGTTFEVCFPAEGPPQSAPPIEPAAISWRGHGTILLVDDEEVVRKLATYILREIGFSVLTATDGVQAIDVFTQHRQEIVGVILDLTMPKMDGAETFRELRRIDPEVRVILSSGYSEEGVIGRFSGSGLAGFIQKPYDFDTVVATLRKAVGGD